MEGKELEDNKLEESVDARSQPPSAVGAVDHVKGKNG